MSDEKTRDPGDPELVDWGVDETLIEENLRRTPTERIENMRAMGLFAEELRRANDRRLSTSR